MVATRISEHVLDTTTYYNTVFIAQWVIDPWLSAVQMLAIVTVWTHACIGINYWLRVRTWYPKWRPFLFTYALLLPTLALAGYVTGGNQVLREAKDHDFVDSALADANLTDETMAAIDRMADIGWILCFTLPLLPFAGRGLRNWYHHSQRPPHPDACQWAQHEDPAGRDGARDAARQRHPACFGLRRQGALHHVPDHGHQGP